MIFFDQLENEVNINCPPQRIISLVPSQTELLYHLGLENEVIGITKFCIHPKKWYLNKTRIGGPKKVDFKKITELKPDLIVGNKEENVKEEIEKLRKTTPVWLSDIYNLQDSIKMIEALSEVCNKKQKGELIINKIKENFNNLQVLQKRKKVLYLIWKNPLMAVGNNTFINSILTTHLGMDNVVKSARYPELSLNNLPETDYVFLSTEPYPFNEKHITEMQKFFPNAKIIVVDGEYFTWYGSRLIETPQYLENLKAEM